MYLSARGKLLPYDKAHDSYTCIVQERDIQRTRVQHAYLGYISHSPSGHEVSDGFYRHCSSGYELRARNSE